DAASHNGVDNIREINEEVKYTPAVGKYKVYIIDEVHMLSTGAFNALLKTLEEPPAHVIFILATTDPQKIPVTILSRCQRFDFQRIRSQAIGDRLREYMENEGVSIEDDALSYIARLADGGMRDALSLLEKCISFYFEETITLEKVLYLVGAVDTRLLFDMVEAFATYDSKKAIDLCDEVNNQGRSIRQFTTDLLVHVRNLLVAKTTHTDAGVLDYSKEYVEALSQQAEAVSIEALMHYIKSLSQLDTELKVASNQKILLEVAVLRLSEPSMQTSEDSLYEKLMMLQQKIEQLEARGVQVVAAQPQAVAQTPVKEIKPTRLPEAVPDDVRELASKWESIKAKMEVGARLGFGSTSAGVIEGDVLYIVHGSNMEPMIQKYIEGVRNLINQEMQKEVKVVPISAKSYEQKTKEVHGTNPTPSDVTLSINDTLRDIQSKLNYDIKTID
ncbi:MAG: DNA polymerase III subunit gamma/tau, partial [Cellulosilyticaceae bacterium]